MRNKGIFILLILVISVLASGIYAWQTGALDEFIKGRQSATADEHHYDEEGHDIHNHTSESNSDHGTKKTDIIHLGREERSHINLRLAWTQRGKLESRIQLLGEIVTNADELAHVVPGLSGIVYEVRKKLGDRVKRGEVMAILESRELADAKSQYLAARERISLAQLRYDREEKLWQSKISAEQDFLDARQALAETRIEERTARQKLLALGISEQYLEGLTPDKDANLTRYAILAPLNGIVISRHITRGEFLSGNAETYIVANMDTVWVDLKVQRKDLRHVHKGQHVSISAGTGFAPQKGTISYIGPFMGEETQTALARVVLPNPGQRWKPGLFVTAELLIGTANDPLLVEKNAVLTIEKETVVFVPYQNGFVTRPVRVGRSNATHIEILAGLTVNQAYVASGNFELKAKMITAGLDSHAGHGH